MAPINEKKASDSYPIEKLNALGVAFDINIKDPKKRIQAFIDAYRASINANNHLISFDQELMQNHIKLLEATGSTETGKATARFTMRVAPEFTSRMGNMHGGAAALILDMCTSMCAAPLASQGTERFGGVSRALSLSFLRPIKEGSQVFIDCEVVQYGQKLSLIRGEIKDATSGKVLCMADHHKAKIDFVDVVKSKI